MPYVIASVPFVCERYMLEVYAVVIPNNEYTYTPWLASSQMGKRVTQGLSIHGTADFYSSFPSLFFARTKLFKNKHHG